jgi:hypothetical protein
MADVLGGRTLGQYELMERLRRGGMGTVYKAYQPSLDRYVAVKVLSTFLAQDPDFTGRFEREARLIAKLDHPNILPVYDYGQEGELIYIVMRYVEGGTLEDKLDRLGQPMDLDTAVEITAQMGEALEYAHQRGIVHRDVKPSNVLMADGNWALLSDFGLARMIGGGARITQIGSGMGTPSYVAPEQARDKAVDGRSDIYSLGVVLFEMLTGRVPFEGETPLIVLYKHLTDPPPPPREINPDIPEAVEQVVLKALAKDPADRFQRVGDIVTALQQAVSGAPVVTAAVSLEAEGERQQGKWAALYTEAAGFLKARWRRLPLWVWAAIVGAILLAAVIAGAALRALPTDGSGSTTVPSPTSTSTPVPPTPIPTVDVVAEVRATLQAEDTATAAAFTPTPTDTPTPTATKTATQTPVPPTATATSTPVPPTAAATHTPTPTPTPTVSIALTIYLRDTNTEMGYAALSADQPNGGMIYQEGQFVYGDAAVQIGDTLSHFDEPEEPGQLPDPWRVEFEFAEELVARTQGEPGFDPKKAWFWVGTLDSESAVGEDKPYHLTMKLYEGDELRQSLQVFFTVADVAGPGREGGPPGKDEGPPP